MQNLETFDLDLDLDLAYSLIPIDRWIRKIMVQNPRPTLLTIRKLKASELMTEKGGSSIILLKEMEAIADSLPNISTETIWSQSNFHSSLPIVINPQDFEYLD